VEHCHVFHTHVALGGSRYQQRRYVWQLWFSKQAPGRICIVKVGESACDSFVVDICTRLLSGQASTTAVGLPSPAASLHFTSPPLSNTHTSSIFRTHILRDARSNLVRLRGTLGGRVSRVILELVGWEGDVSDPIIFASRIARFAHIRLLLVFRIMDGVKTYIARAHPRES